LWKGCRGWSGSNGALQKLKALVIIDMQEAYIGEKSKYKFALASAKDEREQGFANKKELIDCINLRIEKVKRDMAIIYIKNARKGAVSDLVEGLSIVSDLIFLKEKASCFSSEKFTDWLSRNSVHEIEVAGIDGDVCVKKTCVDAIKNGLAVALPLSCIGVINKGRFLKTQQTLAKLGVRIIEFSQS